MKLRWPVVSLDVGGTLIDPWPSVGHIYAASAAAVGFGVVDPADLNRQFAAAWRGRQAAEFDYGRESWARIVAGSFAGLVPRPDSQALFVDAYERFRRAESWRVFADVRPVLAALRQYGVRVVATSNWDERLKPLLQELGLAASFEWVAVSTEIGYHKPDPRLFAAVLRRLSVAPEQILHVGDRALEDVTGALAAGWSARRLRRLGAVHGEISTLHEVIALVIAGAD